MTPAPPRHEDRWRKPAARVVSVVALVSAFALGAWALARVDARPRTHDAFIYADTAALAPDVSGRIIAIHVANNARVKAGTPLVDIDPEPFELRLRQARAQVAALTAQIDVADRQVLAQDSGAQAAAAQVKRAIEQARLARETRNRLEPLLTKGYVTAQQLDEARTNDSSAGFALQAALRQAEQARHAVGDTRSLSAQLDGALAAVAMAERDLRNTVVKAPFDGQVSGLEMAVGSYASAGHPLFSLIDTRHWYAVANFRETELPLMAAGDAATIWLLGDGNVRVHGQVESISGGVRAADPGAPGLPNVERSLKWVIVAQRFPVRILLDDPPVLAQRIGATVTVRIDAHGR